MGSSSTGGHSDPSTSRRDAVLADPEARSCEKWLPVDEHFHLLGDALLLTRCAFKFLIKVGRYGPHEL
jgi:hypothetical protein